MFYLTKLLALRDKKISEQFVDDYHSCQEVDNREDFPEQITITFLLTKMCNIAKYEASQTPKSSQKVFNFVISRIIYHSERS